MKILALDPGTTHLVACIFEKEEGASVITLIWSMMFNVGHDSALLAKACEVIAGVSLKLGVTTALVEYQAPMGAMKVCRWNAFVEGGLSTCLCYVGLPVETVFPSAVKRKLGLASGNYDENKRVAFLFAKEHGQNVSSHHEADCFVLAYWWFLSHP
jgi:hypothetical protein